MPANKVALGRHRQRQQPEHALQPTKLLKAVCFLDALTLGDGEERLSRGTKCPTASRATSPSPRCRCASRSSAGFLVLALLAKPDYGRPPRLAAVIDGGKMSPAWKKPRPRTPCSPHTTPAFATTTLHRFTGRQIRSAPRRYPGAIPTRRLRLVDESRAGSGSG